MAGIHYQNPGITEEQAEEIFAWRLARCKAAADYARKRKQSAVETDASLAPKIAKS